MTQSKELLRNLIIATLDANKAEDVVSIDLNGKTDLADVMIIASGNSDRHIKSLSDKIKETLHKNDYHYLVEESEQRNWILVDAFDVIVHIFNHESRAHYALEELWQK